MKMRRLTIALVLTLALTLVASASTQTIELETRSALLIDQSGSMEDRTVTTEIVNNIDTSEYDVVCYFDTEIATDSQSVGGGNSYICEAIDKVAKGGFTHITVVTDGEQWPADYSALGVYTDLDVTICLTETAETEASDEFINELKSKLINSSLKVNEDVILNDYVAPVYTVEIPEVNQSTEVVEEENIISDSNVSNDTTNTSTNTEVNETESKSHKCLWWLAFVLGVLVAALFDFIHELITRNSGNSVENKGEDNKTDDSDDVILPDDVTDAIATGNHNLVADVSSSMSKVFEKMLDVCKNSNIPEVLTFGSSIAIRDTAEIDSVTPEGATAGWEAIEFAEKNGYKDIMLVSDLEFNGKSFEELSLIENFAKIVVVLPKKYDKENFAKLKKIADKVEVLYL